MNTPETLLVFRLDGQRYALYLHAVQRVVRAAAPAPLPKGPGVIAGVINVGGALVPLIDIRKRLGLPERGLRWTDHLVIARTARRTVALPVDATDGVLSDARLPHADMADVLPQVEHIAGIAKCEDGIILIHDLDRCLSLDEERTLDAALAELP